MADKIPYLREFDPKKDYPLVQAWWEGHGFAPVLPAMLPKVGVIAHLSGRELAAGWLYLDNSTPVCMLEWLVTNPECRGREAVRAIRAITEYMKAMAVAFNYGVMLTTCRQPSLARVHESNGFMKTDENMIHLISLLGGAE